MDLGVAPNASNGARVMLSARHIPRALKLCPRLGAWRRPGGRLPRIIPLALKLCPRKGALHMPGGQLPRNIM